MTTYSTASPAPPAVHAALCVLLAFLTGGCSVSSRNGDAATRSSDGTTPLSQMIAAGDSAGIATKARSECSQLGATGMVPCYEKFLLPVAEAGRVRVALGALNSLAALNAEVMRNGHVYAHGIGIAAGKAGDSVARTFSECTEVFQSGCYHGVIQAYFAAAGQVGATEINALCEPFRASESDRWILFQCVHGMGHGLTALNGHDLPRGLDGCDLLKAWWDRNSCYGGAFMENIVNATAPHHGAARPAPAAAGDGSDAHAGMDHGGDHVETGKAPGPATAKFKAVDASDPLYPCSIMADRYLAACYQMQTSVMLYHTRGDFAAAARMCETAPARMRAVCHASLGRDANAYALQDQAAALLLCAAASSKYQPWCISGLVKNVIDVGSRADDGIALCRKIEAGPNKIMCYTSVGQQIAVLKGTPDDRAAACTGGEAAYVKPCLYGAGVTMVIPPELAPVLALGNGR